MSYRDDLTALAARHDALAREVDQKARELEESRRLLEQAQARSRLPVLDNLRVASPCTADWNQMTGDERSRHCGDCKKDVYNLSGMTRDEAEVLLIERAGNLCARYYQRHDGTILFDDCPVGARHRRRRRWIAVGAVTLLAGSAGLGAALERKPHCESINIQLGPEDDATWVGEVRADDPAPESPPPVHRAEVPSGAWTTGFVAVPEKDVRRLEERRRELSKALKRERERMRELQEQIDKQTKRDPAR
jgi:hypothetical protein